MSIFEQVMQIVAALGPVGGAAAAARWGHRQVMTKLERDYVTLESHRASITTLHNEKNALADRCARLEERNAMQVELDQRQTAEIDFLKAAFLARDAK